MSEFVTTERGDRVAYDRRGPESGLGVVFVAGAGPFRAIDPETTATAERLAEVGVASVVYDRLGRGESPAEGVVDLDRELAAIAALVEVAGGRTVLCGHSSGCSIALRAAVDGQRLDGLALWEAPIVPDTDDTAEWVAEFLRLLEAGDLEGAQVHYMKDMPPEWLEGLRESPIWPVMVSQAGSLRPDAQSLDWATSAPHAELFGDIGVPVRAMLGTETFPEMTASAASLVAAIPGAIRVEVAGADHSWEPEAMAAELEAFVRSLPLDTSRPA